MAGVNTIYVGNLPKNVITRVQVAEVLAEFAIPWEHVGDPRDRCSFIIFQNENNALEALEKINGSVVADGTKLCAGPSYDRMKIYATNFPKTMDPLSLQEILSNLEPAMNLRYIKDYAELSFGSEGALTHFQLSANKPEFDILGKKLFLSYYPSPPRWMMDWLKASGREIPQCPLLDQKRIYISNLPPYYKERQVVELLHPFGPFSSVTAMLTVREMLVAVITYIDIRGACLAIYSLHGSNLDGFTLYSSWAPPTK